MTAAQTFRAARTSAGLSREKLGRVADVSASTIYHIERGEVPSAVVAEKLCRVLGLDADNLWGDR